MNLRYEVDDTNGFAIRVWNDDLPNENNDPFIFQPTWPDNTPWSSKEEAETWAQQLVAMMQDRRNGRPGENPQNPFHSWTEEDEERYQKQLKGKLIEE